MHEDRTARCSELFTTPLEAEVILPQKNFSSTSLRNYARSTVKYITRIHCRVHLHTCLPREVALPAVLLSIHCPHLCAQRRVSSYVLPLDCNTVYTGSEGSSEQRDAPSQVSNTSPWTTKRGHDSTTHASHQPTEKQMSLSCYKVRRIGIRDGSMPWRCCCEEDVI